MSAYEAFAELYDVLMDDVDYDAWADYYLALLTRQGGEVRELCDCACGTGSMSVRFAKHNIRVTGADLSGAMLQKARKKALDWGVPVMFTLQDICQLRMPHPVDAVVCACDGVNYLLDDDRLNAFFSGARGALKAGGTLAFDISSPWKLEHILGNGFFGEDRGDLAYLWSNCFASDKRILTMDLTFFIRRRDDLYCRFDELHVQKAHDPDHLVHLLTDCGFDDIHIYGDRTFSPPGEKETRIHLSATRQ